MRDPIKWATRAVGTTSMFVIMVLGQCGGTAAILAMHYKYPLNPFSVLLVVLYCLWMPSLFLYALRKVLQELVRLQQSCKTEQMRAPSGSC